MTSATIPSMLSRAPSGMTDSPDHPSRRAPHLARLHRSGRAARSLPPAPGGFQGVPRRRLRPRPDDGTDPEGLRHRDRRPPAGDPPALPQLPDHRTPVPARAHPVRRGKGRRGLHLPADARARGRRAGSRGRSRPPDPLRQRLRHAGAGRRAPRLHGQRSLLRHRDVRRPRLRRGGGGPRAAAHPDDRRPARPFPGGPGPDAPGLRVRGAAEVPDGHGPPRRDRGS